MYDTPPQRCHGEVCTLKPIQPMISAPSVTSVALLVALSLFLGFAFEDFFARTDTGARAASAPFRCWRSPAACSTCSIRSHFVPFTAGLLVLGVWLAVFYRQHVGEPDETGEPNVGLVVPLLNVHAYLLGAIDTRLAALDRGRHHGRRGSAAHRPRQLHALARRVDVREIASPANF